jgi:uncharacterized coiled-coil protein SlyX
LPLFIQDLALLTNCQQRGEIKMKDQIRFTGKDLVLRTYNRLLNRRRAWLLIAISLGQAMLTPVSWAQTCNDGCTSSNTYQGYYAFGHNISGIRNAAFGTATLDSNGGGSDNTAIGAYTLNHNSVGSSNTAIGSQALYANTGSSNVATGAFALYSNTTGVANTATGSSALQSNTIGNESTATGQFALAANTTGNRNNAIGVLALGNNTTGFKNLAWGYQAGINLTTGNENIDIANAGVAGESNTIRIGTAGTQTAAFIAGIRGTTVAGGIAVLVDANGRLGTTTSSARFKDNIRPMDKASEAILSLQPVTFHYKKELDPNGIPQFGLVAEEVARVNPDLVVRDEEGKPYTVRYEAVNAMLLNEFLKEHRTVTKQESTINGLRSAVARQEKQIEALNTSLHKVSARLEVVRPAARVVANNH